RRRALGAAERDSRRGPPDRALHAGWPLRDAGDDPQHARGRARPPGAALSGAVADLRGRRCLVTGAASGIGRGTALAAGARGADLYLTDVQAGALEETVDEVRRRGGTVTFAKAIDLTDRDAVVAFAEEVHEAAGGSMDVVMNVAGIAVWGRIDDL